jgi:hypothetical protein
LPLAHPDLDLIVIVLTVAPCIYFGIAEGIRRGVAKKKPVVIPTHPLRRAGDKYSWYFYLAYKYVGPESLIARIPKFGALPAGVLAALALKLVVQKGEQYNAVRQAEVSKL